MSMMSNFADWPVFHSPVGAVLLTVVVLWSLFWKGCGLWHAARREDFWWFVGILLINTVGILEIIYLFGFAKLQRDGLLGRGAG